MNKKITNFENLETQNINGKRFYITKYGKFPSITSILGSFPSPYLEQWRNRVGEEEANKISKASAGRGTNFHLLCEKYLKGEPIEKKQFKPDALQSFYSIKPILNRIDNIYGLEIPLYSKKLKAAGRCDLIANFDKDLSVIDFKTSKREKFEEDIMDYFLQTTFYSLCFFEVFNIKIKNIVIIISVDDGNSQIFIKKTSNFIRPLIDKISEYYKLFHNL